jgi:4a-hydroxytetrahydrobiopterin dehydratase
MWLEKDKQLYREFSFPDFKQAFGFMSKVAEAAEAVNHHPRWTNEYDKVEIWLSTHSEGQITDKDRRLAEEINRIYGENS